MNAHTQQHCEDSQCVPGCHNDDGCAPGQICDVETHTCDEPRCTEDTQCPPSAHCGPDAVCIPGCHNDDGCAEDLVCDVDAHECVTEGCRSDQNCAGLQTCDLDSGLCQSAALCFSEDDCIEEEFCVNSACQQEAPECLNNTECDSGQVCVNNECEATVCQNDEDCSTGRFCTPISNVCGQCREDIHCSGSQVCSNGTCQEPNTCTVNDDCVGGRICMGGACTDPACVQDDREPDDDLQGATLLEGDTTLEGSICVGTSDFFEMVPGLGNGFVFLVSFDPAGGNNAMEAVLYDGDGNIAGAFFSGPDGTMPVAVEQSPSAGSWYVEVKYTFGGNFAYNAQFFQREGGICINDTVEPNNLATDATPVISRRHVGRLCTQDEDWWRVELDTDSTSLLRLRTTEGDNGAAIEIFSDEGAQTLLARDVSPQMLKEITLDAANGTTQWLRLFPNDSDNSYRYLLEVAPQ